MSTITEIQTAAPAGTWTLDAVHSQVGFAVKHGGVSLFKGGFDDVDATLTDGKLSGAAKVTSIRVQDESLTGHLLSPDFFDAERFPTILFDSSELRIEDGDFVAEGQLELKGVSKPIRLEGTIAGPVADRIGITLETTVDRTDFGVSWNMELPDGSPAVENEVKLTADLELVKA